MKTFSTLLSALVLLTAAAAVQGQGAPTMAVPPAVVFDHWSAPEENNVDSAPSPITPAPSISKGVEEEPAPSPTSISVPTIPEQSEEPPTSTGSGSESANTGGFGAGPSVAVALGGAVLIASTLFLGRRRMAAENADNNSQSLGQSADNETL